jgi:hypothetical protein
MTLSVVVSTSDATWLPPGGRADVVADPGGTAPVPTGLVRLLVRRDGQAFCVPRDDTRKLDLPTSAVQTLDDGSTTIDLLAQDVLGRPAEPVLVGYVRNVVDGGTDDYPWPVPLTHFSVWEATGEPLIEGLWMDLDDPGSPLRARHWWPLVDSGH